MAEPLAQGIKRLLQERRLFRIEPDIGLVSKEMQGAEYDLTRAAESLQKRDFKWAAIQAYFSMFHAARALLFSEGYREKSHAALRIALRELFEMTGRLDRKAIRYLEDAMDLREQADYGLEFSEAASAEVLRNAREFLALAKGVLGLS